MPSAEDPTADQPVTRAVLLDARLRPAKSTDRVEIREIRMLPHQAAGLHVHNGPVVGCVLDGSIVFQIEGGPPTVLTAGEVFYEPQGARIARFDAQRDGVRFLGYFLLADGEEALITFPDTPPGEAP